MGTGKAVPKEEPIPQGEWPGPIYVAGPDQEGKAEANTGQESRGSLKMHVGKEGSEDGAGGDHAGGWATLPPMLSGARKYT